MYQIHDADVLNTILPSKIMYIIIIKPRSTTLLHSSKLILKMLELASGTSSPFSKFKAWKWEMVEELINLLSCDSNSVIND